MLKKPTLHLKSVSFNIKTQKNYETTLSHIFYASNCSTITFLYANIMQTTLEGFAY